MFSTLNYCAVSVAEIFCWGKREQIKFLKLLYEKIKELFALNTPMKCSKNLGGLASPPRRPPMLLYTSNELVKFKDTLVT